MDSFIVALGTGLAASAVAGRGLVYGVERVPQRWRGLAEWAVVIGAGLIAVLASLLPESAWTDAIFVFVVAALPGVITYFALRTLLASALVSIVPLYIAIGGLVRGRTMHAPAIGLDRALPLSPPWVLVYASLYVMVMLPLLVVRDQRLFRRTLQAYLFVWLVAYAVFLAYPTVTLRPATVPGGGFLTWLVMLIYALDTRVNCFPSLHVAQSFVSALACYRVRKSVGITSAVWAALIGVSTLFTKQHYALDVIAGAALGYLAYLLFLRGYPRELVSREDWERAPRRALQVVGAFGVLVGAVAILYVSGKVVP